MYDEWGFFRNPFDPNPLLPNETGEQLLVGRNSSLKKIKARLRGGTKAATIEGMNGIGKTSVANVAAYQLYKETFEKNTDALFLPCRAAFQISAEVSPKQFRLQVLREVVQTLLHYSADLPIAPGRTQPYKSKALDRWLNSTNSKNYQVGLAGFTLGFGQADGSTAGFDESGFEKMAVDWLKLVFPEPRDGGVICVIDNLELLQTSIAASKLIEELRDPLLTIPGIRWILCGTNGIFHGAGESERVAGFLHTPLTLSDVPDAFLGKVFEERVLKARVTDEAFLPITMGDFSNVFQLFRGNLRYALSTLDAFCFYVYDEGIEDVSELKSTEFQDWLQTLANSKYRAVLGSLGKELLDSFRKMCNRRDATRYDQFDFAIGKDFEFSESISKFVKSELLIVVENDEDHSKDYLRISAKGRLVAMHLDNMEDGNFIPVQQSGLPPDDEWFKTSPQWSGETQVD